MDANKDHCFREVLGNIAPIYKNRNQKHSDLFITKRVCQRYRLTVDIRGNNSKKLVFGVKEKNENENQNEME